VHKHRVGLHELPSGLHAVVGVLPLLDGTREPFAYAGGHRLGDHPYEWIE